MLVFLSKLPTNINQTEFEKVVRSICADSRIKIANPNWLMICMNAESNMQLVTNGIGAYGFIQITKKTAREDLGTTTDALRAGTWQNYMKYVRQYLINRVKENGIPKNAYDLYALIHFPVAFEKSGGYVLYSAGSAAYKGNSGLDYNKDGKVQWSEVMAFLDSKCPILYDKTQLMKAEDTTQNFYYTNYAWTEVAIITVTVVSVLAIVLINAPKAFYRNIKNRLQNGKV
ncbi:hypothetical protein LV89_01833 [Arcicella aurantiaca]|uniref:Transglycosylase-like protein with SLT domain n=1 Tax=Arcicella aurantiaca TaxID=591202 RepID=A0A316EAQ6_9BACT|nr:hypothetical protein [Arcicella aurantiaca]PWK27021.1 hypothetical protein LV89_01833 [Arcicella aurantiaca]